VCRRVPGDASLGATSRMSRPRGRAGWQGFWILLLWMVTARSSSADFVSVREAFGQLPFVAATRGMLGDTMEKRHDLISKAKEGVEDVQAQATSAFQSLPIPAVPYGEIMASVHEGGLLSVLRGFHWVGKGTGKQLNWSRQGGGYRPLDLEGSEPDHCLPGYSQLTQLRRGPLTRNIDRVNRELASAVVNALSQDGWEKVTEKDEIKVWIRDAATVHTGRFPEGVGPTKLTGPTKFLCVRAIGIIDSPLPQVYDLFRSNEFVREYNEYCQECEDVGFIDPATKVTWATSKPFFPFSSRDFVTRSHYRRLRDGSLVLATMSEQLPCADFQERGLSDEYVRMDMTLGGYVLRPIDGGRKTEFQMLSLANPGGALDSTVGAMMLKVCVATGPIGLIQSVRRLAPQVAGYRKGQASKAVTMS